MIRSIGEMGRSRLCGTRTDKEQVKMAAIVRDKVKEQGNQEVCW